MSYDLNLWTVDRVKATAIQKLIPGAKILENRVELVGNGWLVAIGHSI